MTGTAREYQEYDPSPIDLVQDIAELRSWDIDRLGDDQIAMAVDGAWRVYSLSLAWYEPEETLRMVCTFDLEVGDAARAELLKTVEAANDRLWIGGFNLWQEQGLMAFRYGLTLRGGASVTSEQIDAMLHGAVENCERFFPAFHLVAAEGVEMEDAMAAALLEAAGRA